MNDRKIAAMYNRYGAWMDCKCRGCSHLISGEYHGKRYHKCELYGLSRSEATDWRLSYAACGLYDVDVDMGEWVPVMYRLTSSPAPPLDGQITLEI